MHVLQVVPSLNCIRGHALTPLPLVVVRGLQIIGTHGCTRQELANLFDLIQKGKITTPVKQMPLSEAAQAHKILEEKGAIGRLVLVPGQNSKV